jgi:glycerol kinase
MGKKYIMALDAGTTGTRALLFNRDGDIVASSYQEFTQIYPQPGWVEHNPEEIWQSMLHCIKDVLSKGHADPREIAGIGITNQRETTVLWDRKTGKPLHNAIVWMCRRSAPICEELMQRGLEKEVRDRTGLMIDPYFSATKIMWMRDNVPGVKDKIERNEVCAGCIDSWLMWNLSGGKAHVTDYANASRTMLFNIKTLKWDEALLKATGIPQTLMPEPRPSSGVFTTTDEKVLFGARVPVAGAAGDQQSALFGQACFKPGMIKNTYGTALVAIMNIGSTFIPSKSKLLTDLAWGFDHNVTYAFEGVIFHGGTVVQWLRDGLKIIEKASDTEPLANRVPDTGGVYIVPAFTGLCSPYWDPYARGTIVGITRGTTHEHMARAALESIAYQVRDILEAMVSDSGNPFMSLRVDGGATVNDFLMQFQADILGIPLEKPVITEMTGLGAAYLAGLGVSFWQDQDELSRHWKIEKVFEPRMSEDQKDTLYAGWKKAVGRSLGWARDMR